MLDHRPTRLRLLVRSTGQEKCFRFAEVLVGKSTELPLAKTISRKAIFDPSEGFGRLASRGQSSRTHIDFKGIGYTKSIHGIRDRRSLPAIYHTEAGLARPDSTSPSPPSLRGNRHARARFNISEKYRFGIPYAYKTNMVATDLPSRSEPPKTFRWIENCLSAARFCNWGSSGTPPYDPRNHRWLCDQHDNTSATHHCNLDLIRVNIKDPVFQAYSLGVSMENQCEINSFSTIGCDDNYDGNDGGDDGGDDDGDDEDVDDHDEDADGDDEDNGMMVVMIMVMIGVPYISMVTEAAWRTILSSKATVAEQLACSPHTKAILVLSPSGSLRDFRMWISCQTMPLVGGFSHRIYRFPRLSIPALLHTHLASP
ncbi:hypothetical protein PR048_027492 [Dryococelus australis]|uniref:Uncharacterized protein n=1 Tax=Dryococelus australis TaxID=614101 RepID=A0ABQ9GGP3_9NEOP|nr:hypothetical protein PR048_027492 [Dryococelus australis]